MRFWSGVYSADMIDSRAETTPHEERSRRGKKERRKHTVCCVAQQTDVQEQFSSVGVH